MTVLSLFAILLLPRQFHVGVVENHSEAEIRRAAWLFPLYLVLINLFVVPIATAGLLSFPADADGDMFVLALPLKAHSEIFALIAFVGGLSAATAMVIVESVALAIMVSNDIVIPLVLKRRAAGTGPSDAGAQLLMIRRVAIFVILCLAYIYYRSAGPAQLASIGLLSFAAIAQFAPAFLGGLIWRRGNARGAIAGMSAGILVWGYTLLLPSLSDADILGARVLTDGLFGLAWLRPQALFGLDLPPLVHGVLLSLTVNIALFIGCSLSRRRTAIEGVQADLFVPSTLAPRTPSFRLRRASVTVEELTVTVARYLGEERTRESFSSFAASRRVSLEPEAEADFQLIQYGEYLLASAIGAASSRLVLSLLLRKRTVSTKDALKLLDDANAAIHYNREILQTALDHVRQGIAVFDKELALVCWNRQFGELFDLPHALTRVGIALDEILRNIARQHGHDAAELDAQVRGPHRPLHLRSRAVPRTLCRARPGDRSARQPHARRRPGHDLHRHHAEREGGRSARARQCDLGAPRARAHQGADPAQHRAGARQGRGRRRQCLEDPLCRRREPRHPAAAQRRPALCHQPDRAPARRRGRRSRAQCRCLAGSGRGDLRRAARHFPARHRRDETGNDRLPHRRVAAAAGDGVCRRWRGRRVSRSNSCPAR